MPLRPSERARYPKNWKSISADIRRRSGGQCECLGECGSGHHHWWVRLGRYDADILSPRCPNLNREPSQFTGSLVVLSVAHLDHTPENCDDTNLRAMCQSCHLNYDREHHAETRARTLAARLEASA